MPTSCRLIFDDSRFEDGTICWLPAEGSVFPEREGVSNRERHILFFQRFAQKIGYLPSPTARQTCTLPRFTMLSIHESFRQRN